MALDRSRSRSPRSTEPWTRNVSLVDDAFRAPKAKQLADQHGLKQSWCAWSAMEAVGLLPERQCQIAKVAIQAVDHYHQCKRRRHHETAWAEVTCAELDDVGGAVKKVAQQCSQLPSLASEPVQQAFKPLGGEGRPRTGEAIKTQIEFASTGVVSEVPEAVLDGVVQLLGCGCAAEVSLVNTASGTYAYKTVNLQQKELFDLDRSIFVHLSSMVQRYLVPFCRAIGLDTKEIVSIADRVQLVATDDTFVQFQTGQFNLTIEARNTEEAARKLKTSMLPVFAPEVIWFTEDVMKMQAIPGVEATKFDFRNFPSFPHVFIKLVCWMMHNNFLHVDLHPANMKLLGSAEICGAPWTGCLSENVLRAAEPFSICILDWAEVLTVPEEEVDDVITVVKCALFEEEGLRPGDSLSNVFTKLRVVRKDINQPLEEHMCWAAVKELSVLEKMKENFEPPSAPIKFPGWWLLLDKAVNAMAISLKTSGCSVEEASCALRAALL